MKKTDLEEVLFGQPGKFDADGESPLQFRKHVRRLALVERLYNKNAHTHTNKRMYVRKIVSDDGGDDDDDATNSTVRAKTVSNNVKQHKNKQ